MKMILLVAAALALAGCVSTPDKISGIQAGVSMPITNSTIVTDLQSAAYNLDNAVAVGALAADDPAPKCLHDVLVKSGIEALPGVEPAKSFAPKHDGVASAGAIAYIITQQAKQISKNGVPVDPSCEALVGRIVIDGAHGLKKLVPLIGR